MHTTGILCFALALTAHAVPVLRLKANTTVERRSAGYEVVNVGGQLDSPLPPVVETVSVTSPPQQTVTVTISPTPSSSLPTPCSSSINSSITPSPTGVLGKRTSYSDTMEKIAHMFGKSFKHPEGTNSRVYARSNSNSDSNTTADSRLAAGDDKFASQETDRSKATSSRVIVRSSNVTELASHISRGLPNTTESQSARPLARSSNGTLLQARNTTIKRED